MGEKLAPFQEANFLMPTCSRNHHAEPSKLKVIIVPTERAQWLRFLCKGMQKKVGGLAVPLVYQAYTCIYPLSCIYWVGYLTSSTQLPYQNQSHPQWHPNFTRPTCQLAPSWPKGAFHLAKWKVETFHRTASLPLKRDERPFERKMIVFQASVYKGLMLHCSGVHEFLELAFTWNNTWT